MAQQAGPTGNHVGDDARRLPGARFHCRARGDHVADRARVDELSAALRKRAPAPTRRGSL
jgi:hypothetical protein